MKQKTNIYIFYLSLTLTVTRHSVTIHAPEPCPPETRTRGYLPFGLLFRQHTEPIRAEKNHKKHNNQKKRRAGQDPSGNLTRRSRSKRELLRTNKTTSARFHTPSPRYPEASTPQNTSPVSNLEKRTRTLEDDDKVKKKKRRGKERAKRAYTERTLTRRTVSTTIRVHHGGAWSVRIELCRQGQRAAETTERDGEVDQPAPSILPQTTKQSPPFSPPSAMPLTI